MKHLLIFVCTLISFSARSQDSLVKVKTGAYAYIPTSDTTADSLSLPSFIEIEPKAITGTTSLAHFLTIRQVCGGDFQTFAMLNIKLLDSVGNSLFWENYKLCDSRYQYASSNCAFRLAYVYWVVLNLPELDIEIKKQ